MDITSTKDIERRVREIDEITAWSPVSLGSILRATSYSYKNWGIGITPENLDWLYGASQEAYSVEWKDTDPSLNALVGEASKKADLGDANASMNGIIGGYAAQMACASDKGRVSVLDIGAGAGATTLAMTDYLERRAKHPALDIFLIEPSKSRTDAATNAIKVLDPAVACIAAVFNLADTEAMRQIDVSSIDIAITNAAIHHNSFNFHLGAISKALAPSAPLIMGDWYDGLSEKPERVYWLLLLLANHRDVEMEKNVLNHIQKGSWSLMPFPHEENEASEFREYLNLDMTSCRKAFQNLTEDERKADAAIMKFWLEVGRIFSAKGTKAPIYVIEGHERASRRETALFENGFCFDRECQEKYRLLTKARGKGNLNVVSVAKKRPVGAIKQ